MKRTSNHGMPGFAPRLKGGRAMLAAGLLALLGACGAQEAGEVYPMEDGALRQVLLGIDEMPPVFGSNYVETSVVNNGDGTITWTGSQNFKPLMRFIARTEAVDEGHTRVTIEIAGPTSDKDDPIAKRMAENPEIRDFYLAAMTEQVDAALEGREFDLSAISGQMAIAAVSNIGNMSADLDRVVEEENRREAENVARAYEQEANGGWDASEDGW